MAVEWVTTPRQVLERNLKRARPKFSKAFVKDLQAKAGGRTVRGSSRWPVLTGLSRDSFRVGAGGTRLYGVEYTGIVNDRGGNIIGKAWVEFRPEITEILDEEINGR